jgi:hypothetical protein
MTAQITADAVPTVVGKRFGAHGLRIACPFCKGPSGGVRYHEHGTGYQKGTWRRLAHCKDRYLSPELRARRRGQTGRSLSHTIICEEDSEMEAPPLAPNNVVKLVPSPSSSFRTTR